MPPVTLIYLGARRTGILATEADIRTLFVLSHNASVCVFMHMVCVLFFAQQACACVFAYMRVCV